MRRNEERTFIPCREAWALQRQYREARRNGDLETAESLKKRLVGIHVQLGEHFKMSGQPNVREAMKCLEKALRLDPGHPIANYRYAHLLYGKKEYQSAAFHFKKALDGNKEEGLNDSQTLVAQIMTVSCGARMAVEADREIEFLLGNRFLSWDRRLADSFRASMIRHCEEMMERFMYIHRTPEGMRNVSRDAFLDYQDRVADHEVLLSMDDGMYRVEFRNDMRELEPLAFYIVWILIRADDFVDNDEIGSALDAFFSSEEMRSDTIRQQLHRLSRRLPFWHEVIETKEAGRKTFRRRREGITWSLFHHSWQVVP
jgi:tetratricopeptide (TPR) repeat protein